MEGEVQSSFQTDRISAQCRGGPIQQRSCTDFYCCIIYLLLLAVVITFGIMCAQGAKFTQSQIQEQLSKAQIGKPLLSISKATVPILLALACVLLLSLILMLTTFIIPQLVTYLYIPLTLLLMLLMGGAFLYRYFGKVFPFINQQAQEKFVGAHSTIALGVGILFLLGFFITIITICCKREKFKNMLPVLKMARICFWQNCYIFFLAIFLSILSIVFTYCNILLLGISQNDKSSQNYINSKVLAGLIVLQMLFTHGFMQSLSDFIFQAISILWYFNGKKLGPDYSKCGSNYSGGLGLAMKHIGTIAFGSIYAYIPDFMNSWFGTCEKTTPRLYSYCCYLHKFSCRKVSRFSHSMTILQNSGFCSANSQMFSLRNRTKSILPQIYMMGSFYAMIVKILVTMAGLVICWVLMLQSSPEVFGQIMNIVPPLIIVVLISSEIGTHFTNCGGLVGDTLSFMYNVDLEIQKVHFGELQPSSCPPNIREIIHNVKMGERVYQS